MFKKIFWLLAFSFILVSPVFAEEVYCGDYDGKPAYLEVESILYTATRTGDWVVTDKGVFPKYYHHLTANILLDGVWYEVVFNKDRGSTTTVIILDKYKKKTYKYVNTLKFDFAFPTVDEYFPIAQQRRSEAIQREMQEADRKAIEDAKRNNAQ